LAYGLADVVRAEVAVVLFDLLDRTVPELGGHHGERDAFHNQPRRIGVVAAVKCHGFDAGSGARRVDSVSLLAWSPR